MPLLLFVATSSGCAFGTRTVTLAYVAPPSPQPADARGAVAILPFVDGRTAARNLGSEVGRIKNGYGMVTASVQTSSDPAAWATDSIAGGLTERGYAVERGTDASAVAAGLPVLTGSLVEAFCDMDKDHIDATVQVEVTLTRDGERLFVTSCVGRNRERTWLGWSTDYQDRLVAAMQQLVTSCTAKLAPHLTPKP